MVTALFTWPAHFSASRPPFYLKPRAVPLSLWIPNIVLFWGVNILNNLAFSYRISVPVHIILRSGGSVTTMLVGYVWGNRYSRVRVFSVALLTIGITLAAYSDAQSQVQPHWHPLGPYMAYLFRVKPTHLRPIHPVRLLHLLLVYSFSSSHRSCQQEWVSIRNRYTPNTARIGRKTSSIFIFCHSLFSFSSSLFSLPCGFN